MAKKRKEQKLSRESNETKLERYVSAALSGLCSNPKFADDLWDEKKRVAIIKIAVSIANETLDQLDIDFKNEDELL